MEILMCSALCAENSCHSQEKPVMEFVQDAESNCVKHAEEIPQEKKEDPFLPSLKVSIDTMQGDSQEPCGEDFNVEEGSNESSQWGFGSNGQKSGIVLDHDDENLDEQIQCKEACLDFQNSYVDVNTIDSEPVSENKEELPISTSKWPEQDDALALWVKWRGKWQAGIKCERSDWPLATVKAKPTHDRKSYIVIFFPHKKNYSWADTMLACSIDEVPQPIAHRSHKVGAQLVEDLTVARRFIMKKLVIGMLNIVDQLPLQALVETARDLIMWRQFAAEASHCKSYPDLGRLLSKLGNMLLQQYFDANWLQHSFHLWMEKCQNALSADSIELLTEELVNSILWNELNSLRDGQGQPSLGCDWKMWKQEVMKTFSITQSLSGGGGIEQQSKNGIEHVELSPSMTSLPISRKRPKLEVRRAEPHNSAIEKKTCREHTVLQDDLGFSTGHSTITADNALEPSNDEFLGQQIAPSTSPCNATVRWDGVADTLKTELSQKKDSLFQPPNGVVKTKGSDSKVKSRHCIAFIEAKGRQCERWANDGDDYCCVHLMSRSVEPHNSVIEDKNCKENTILQNNSGSSTAHSTITLDSALELSHEELLGQQIAQTTSPSISMDKGIGVVDTFNAKSTQMEGSSLQPANGVVETKTTDSRVNYRKCIAFIEAKGRQCVRWAVGGDDYCCAHLTSRVAQSVKAEVMSPVEASMCQGTTTQGTRCKHRSLPGISFCKKHRPHVDGMVPPSSPGSQLKRKHDQLVDKSEELTSKDVVMVGEVQKPLQEQVTPRMVEKTFDKGEYVLTIPEQSAVDSNSKNIELARCVGMGIDEGHANCPEIPKRHSPYCDKHIPSWLKRARNGKSRIVSKEVYMDLLRTCSYQKQRLHLHQACDIFYKLFKSILSLRNQVPDETQYQWALSEASKDLYVAEFLMKLVFREKERLTRIWGFNPAKDALVSHPSMEEQALVPLEEEVDDGSFKCKICDEVFSDDQTLGTHWIDSHNKEAQWLFRGYACAICLDSFTNRKVLETHVQERHHAQFVEHCMLIQCIPCGSHFGNSEELWSHVLSVHTEGFRQSKRGDINHQSVGSQNNHIPLKLPSVDNSERQGSIRKFVCRFCGLKFDLLPDLGRHHQAAHMRQGLVSSHPKKKGLRFFSYRLKSGRLSRPRFKKGLGASYRLRNKGSIILKKRLRPVNPIGAGGLNVQSHSMDTASVVRLTEAQCLVVAKMLSSEAQRTRARPSNHEILCIARSACCKISVQKSLKQKYGELPERLYIKAAKLCSEHNTPIDWHREDFNCSKGCKIQEDDNLGSVVSGPINECGRMIIPLNPQEEYDMDECHFVIRPQHFRWRTLQTIIILSDDISFGQERVPVPCVVDKDLIDSIHNPTYGFDGQAFFMPWESFTYATKPLLSKILDVNMHPMQNMQLGCSCSQLTCCPETCDHVYLFNNDYEYAKDIDGKLVEGRFPYDDKGRLVLEDKYLVYECNHLCKCSSKCLNRVLQNGVRVKLEVFRKGVKGWAVRTRETILRGTFVCEYVGEVLKEQEAIRRCKRKEGCQYFYDLGTHIQRMGHMMEGRVKYVIDSTKHGNVSRFINHSCYPNLGSHLVLVESMDFEFAHVGFYAKQDIMAGEELCFNYHSELQAGNE